MGKIRINTPKGPVLVNIAGETPTDEEKKLIIDKMDVLSEANRTPSSPAIVSPEVADINRYYATRQRLMNEGKLAEEEPTEEAPKDLKDPDVDYTSGLQDLSIRLGFSNKELDSEKAAYLTDIVGANGFRQDKGGRFIITKKGREKLNLGEGKEFAIDEEGFSRYDIVDFTGEAGLPLATGVIAGVLTGGLGFFPAMLASGAAMGLGKLIDETVEYANGYQRQTKADIARDVAFEAGIGFLGEGAGRAISSIAGRFLKGSAGEAAEEGRKLGRVMLEKGYRPTIEGAAPGAFSIVGRAQAIYEGVIPNKKAALENVKQLKKDIISFKGKEDSTVTNLMNTIRKDIEELYGTPEEKLATAQRVLGQEIEKELEKVMAPLRQGKDLGPQLLKSLNSAKEAFQRQSDGLFKVSGDLLGDGQRIIPIGQVNNLFKTLGSGNSSIRQIIGKGKPIGNILRAAEARAIETLKSQGIAKPNSAQIQRVMTVTPLEAQQIRTAISELSFSPQFIATVNDKSLNDLSKAINTSFVDAEGIILNKINRAGAVQQGTVTNFTGPRTFVQQQQELQKGLRYYQRARAYYAAGMERFKDTIVTGFVKNANAAPGNVLDVKGILDHVIKPGKPEKLSTFLKSIKGIRTGKRQPFDPPPQTVRFGEEDLTIPQAKAKLAELELGFAGVTPEASQILKQVEGGAMFSTITQNLRRVLNENGIQVTRGMTPQEAISRLQAVAQRVPSGLDTTVLKQGIREAEEAVADRMAFGIASGTGGEAVRKQLAGEYISRLLDDPDIINLKNGALFVDGNKLARQINKLGATKNVLFKDELAELNELTRILRSTGAEVERGLFDEFSGRPLVEAIRGVKEAVKNQKAVNKDSFVQALNTGDGGQVMNKLFAKGNAGLIKDFMQNTVKFGDEAIPIPAHKEFKDAVEEAAMGRILRTLGDVNKPTFSDDFLSGRLGAKLQKVLADDYGEDTIVAMFGKEKSDQLFQLSEIMKRASQQPMAGKGGLAPATIALSLTAFSFMIDPLTTGGALLFYTTMSNLLRKKSVLKMITSSREPGADTIASVLRDIQTATQKANLQGLTGQEGPAQLTPEARDKVREIVPQVLRGIPSVIPNVSPASAATSAGNIDPTNPIVNPNPATQAVAQTLNQRPPS